MAGSNGKGTDVLALTASYKPGWLADCDKRKTDVRAVLNAREALIRDLGGDLSTQKAMLVDRLIFLCLRLTTLERTVLVEKQEIDWAHYGYTVNVLAGLLAKLGLDRIPKAIQSLSEYRELLARRDAADE